MLKACSPFIYGVFLLCVMKYGMIPLLVLFKPKSVIRPK